MSNLKTTFGILTVSDRCYAKTAEDKSGTELERMIREDDLGIDGNVLWTGIVPDDVALIQGCVTHCCDVISVNVLLITGGTGLAPRDITPEAVRKCIDREVPGISYMILQKGLQETPFASLSRSVVGVRGKTLIACLPGSLKGSVESLKAIAPILTHAVDLIRDDRGKVAVVHKEVEQVIAKSKTDEKNRLRESVYPMVAMDSLPELFSGVVSRLNTRLMLTENAVGYVLAESVISTEDIPQVRTSMMDGYVVHKIYTSTTYTIVGESLPGGKIKFLQNDNVEGFSLAGTYNAIKVSTGSPIPAGGEYVIPIENTSLQSTVTFRLTSGTHPQFIREIGSDVFIGQVLIPRDSLITESELGVLAAVGRKEISVITKPVIAVLSTGDELQEPWTPLKPFGVRDSNKIVLKSLLHSWGFRTIDLGIVKDDPDSVLNALQKAFNLADAVITTGGMSMGQRDIIKDVLTQDLGVKIHFGRLCMKPGKPTGFGTFLDGTKTKYWFGLPGNPASAFVTSHVVVLPVLKILSGWTSQIFPEKILAIAGHDISNTDTERLEYQRGYLNYAAANGELYKTPHVFTTGAAKQRSSSIYGCSRATCLVEVPPGKNIAADAEVSVLLLK